MRSLPILACLAGVALVGCEAGGVAAPDLQAPTALAKGAPAAQGHVEPVSTPIVHPCTGEVILMEGAVNQRFTFRYDGAGGLHMSIHANPQGLSGVGADGTRYQAVGASNQTLKVRPGSAEVYHANSVFRIVGQGRAQDFSQHVLTHLTVTPAGDVTAEVVRFEESCS